MIDWETHKIIDILPSRETAEVQKWLSTYPNLKKDIKDGASTYASAGRNAHPNGRNSFQMLRSKVLLHELLYNKIN